MAEPIKITDASLLVLLLLGCGNSGSVWGYERAKNNGDIYVVNETRLPERTTIVPKSMTVPSAGSSVDFDEVMKTCNSSFSIPMDYFVEFNTNGELPDLVDKTGMCYIRCFYEKSGLLEDWQLNADRIRQNIWPATGDTLEYCQKEGKSEANACVRAYAIAKCLMIRAIVDARSSPKN